MLSVYQHWDPLHICVVGRSYPPEFYSWISKPKVRSLFEKIAIETEEDFQKIIKKLEEFNVKVMRPDLPTKTIVNGKYVQPPMTPRDYTGMFGAEFYESCSSNFNREWYKEIADSSWAECFNWNDFNNLPKDIQTECKSTFGFGVNQIVNHEYDKIFEFIRLQGNNIHTGHLYANTAMCSRIGRDLFWGTQSYGDDLEKIKRQVESEFSMYRNHVVNTGGHSDGTYCPVCPGLIISLHDVPTYANTYPDWEVVYLEQQSWDAVKDFLKLKQKNQGKWWIPGFENDHDVTDTVETWLKHWTGYIEETVFDVNMLIIDPKNVIVFNYNKKVFDALSKYGITPHIIKFRHRYFWDGGIHCVTSDLHREGTMQDYF